MKQLSGLDATFLYLERPEMPMHVGALNVYELPAGFRGRFATAVRRHMAERMPLMPVLRRRLWWMPLNLANPAWVDAEPDLKYHVVEHRLPASAKSGDGMAAIEAMVGELHAQPLDRGRPLWRFHVLEGLAPSVSGRRRVALFSQFHHAAVDGQAAVALAHVILDSGPQGRQLDIRPSKRSRTLRLGLSQMLRGALANEAMQVAGIVRNLPSTVGTLTDAAGQALRRSGWLGGLLGAGAGASGSKVSNITLAPRTVFNQSIGTGRAFAGVSLPLAEVKAVGREHGATLNDVVLLICGTALRRYLQQHKSLPRKSLVAAVPISLRKAGDTTSDNQASMSLVSLGTNIGDLRRRFDHVKAATAAMKSTMGSLRRVLPLDFPSIGVPWLIEALTTLYGKARLADRMPLVANLVISNVPGPPVTMFMAGARMTCNYPTSIVIHGMALNITVESYDDRLDFGMVADSQAVPDLRALARAVEIAFDDLRALDADRDADDTSVGPSAGALQAARRGVKATVGGVGRVAQEAARAVTRSAVDAMVGQAVGAVARARRPAKTGATDRRRRGR